MYSVRVCKLINEKLKKKKKDLHFLFWNFIAYLKQRLVCDVGTKCCGGGVQPPWLSSGTSFLRHGAVAELASDATPGAVPTLLFCLPADEKWFTCSVALLRDGLAAGRFS